MRALLPGVWVLAGLLALGASAQQQPALNSQVIEHIQAGLKARQENRVDEEVREFEIVVGLAPRLAEAHMNLGLALRKQGKREEAGKSFQTAIGIKPHLVAAQAILGLDSLTVGRLREALTHLEAAYDGDSSNPDVNKWLGMAYLELGRYQEAASRLEAAGGARPEDTDVLYYLTVAHAKASEQARRKLLESAPDSARAHQASAERAAASGWKQQALEEYQQAAELGPELPGMQGGLGDLYAAAAQYTAAEKAYRKELERRPGHATLNFRCGEAILKQGRAEEAFPYLDRALQLDPTLIDSYFQLEAALSQEGKFELAQETLRRLTESEIPITAKILAHHRLAELLKTRGDRKQASKHEKIVKRLTKDLEKASKKQRGDEPHRAAATKKK